VIAIRSYIPSLLTFPGVVLRQFVHKGFCKVLGVRVLDVRYFRRDTPAGYVFHEMPKRFGISLLLVLGPLVVHSLFCFAICFPTMIPLRFYEEGTGVLDLFQLWIGLSIGMHAFPPFRDVGNLWDLTKQEVMQHGKVVRLTFPLVGFLRIAQRLSLYGFDMVYAAIIGLAIPWALLEHFFQPI
jgi:hypothetical protein